MTPDSTNAPPESGSPEEQELEEEAADEAVSEESPPEEAAPGEALAGGEAPGPSLEKKLERLATFSLLTVGTLMKLIEARGLEALGPEGHEKLAKARDGVVEGIKTLDDWIESEEGQASNLDLAGLRSRLVQMTQQLDIWTIDEETPPS